MDLLIDLQEVLLDNIIVITLLVIFLDLSKAFDVIDHKTLLYKLPYFGIRGLVLNWHDWIENYLSDRYNFTCYNSCESCYKMVQCGVPQGSILGASLVLIIR